MTEPDSRTKRSTGPRRSRRRPLGDDVGEAVEFLRSSGPKVLCEILASLRRPVDIEALLDDLLTPKEKERLATRVCAILAFHVAQWHAMPEVQIVRYVGLNYTTYARAKRLWPSGAGATSVVLKAAERVFSDLRAPATDE